MFPKHIATSNFWGRRTSDQALFLPAIQSNWLKVTSHSMEQLRPEGPSIEGFETSYLNFLQRPNEGTASFWWPALLYSAGHASLNLGRLEESAGPLLNRTGKTCILADSGGYQVSKAVKSWNLPWDDSKECDEKRLKIIRWQESIADWLFTLDVPSRTVNTEGSVFKNFQQCLDATKRNIEFWRKHTDKKLINVLHGESTEEFKIWYDGVKQYELEGWSIATLPLTWFEVLERVIYLRDQGEFDRANWLHLLGRGQPHHSVGYTAIKKALRDRNPNIEVSFDNASASREAGVSQLLHQGWMLQASGNGGLRLSEKTRGTAGDRVFRFDGWELTKDQLRKSDRDHELDDVGVAILTVANIKNQIISQFEMLEYANSYPSPGAIQWVYSDLSDLLCELAFEYKENGPDGVDQGKVIAALDALNDEVGIAQWLPGYFEVKKQLYDLTPAWVSDMAWLVGEIMQSETPGTVMDKHRTALEQWFGGAPRSRRSLAALEL